MIRRSLSKCLGLSLSIGLIFGSTGCSTLQIATGLGLKQPEVSLSALSVKDVSLTSMRIVARLNISNPNRFRCRSCRLQLFIGGRGMASCRWSHR